MKKAFSILGCFVVLLLGCKSAPKHPIYGKWKLAQVADSLVLENPDEVTMEFNEEGKLITTGGPESSEADFLFSEDSTIILILVNKVVVDELKILQLTKNEMIIAEGKQSVRFVKQDD